MAWCDLEGWAPNIIVKASIRTVTCFTAALMACSRNQEDPALLSLGDRIVLPDPVLAEIVGYIKELHILEAHGVELLVGGPDIRALTPGTTPAVEHDELSARQRLGALVKPADGVRGVSRADEFGAGDVCLHIEHSKADLDEEWLRVLGRT